MAKDWTGNTKSIYVCNGASNHSDGIRAEDDFYASEPKTVDMLCAVETFSPVVWECACGAGHMSEALKRNGYTVLSSDIVDRGYIRTRIIDFLRFGEKASQDSVGMDIITNPPYKYAKEFVETALRVVKSEHKVAMLLKLTFLESKSRRELFSKCPPKCVWVFSERVQCAKNGDFEKYKKAGVGTAVAYAWFVWVKGFQGDTVVKWL